MRKNILVVNNKNGIRNSYERILGDDHQVVKTSSSKEALNKVSKKNFHLLIIDIDLPNIESLNFLRTLRKLDARIPVIMISAVNKVEMAVEAMKSGTNNYFTKPFNINEFKETVEELSNKYIDTSNILPLDIEIVINKVKEEMLAKGADLREAGKNFEKKLLKTVLEKVDGNRTIAANFLGVDNKVLSREMAVLGLST
ncbi:MAG: response regulator [Nitrospirae bacterium]|nr:response regulator [Nitrospirota bacterium]